MLVAVSFNGGTTYHSGLSGTMSIRDGGASTSNIVRFQKANVPPYVLFGGDDVASNLQTYTIMAEEDTDLYISGIHIIDEDLKTYVAHEKEGKTGRKWGGGKTGLKMVLDRKITVTLRAYVMTPERTPLDNVLFFGEEAATTLSGTCTCAHEDYVTANAALWAEKDDINYNLSLLKLRVSAKLHTTHHTPHTAHHTPPSYTSAGSRSQKYSQTFRSLALHIPLALYPRSTPNRLHLISSATFLSMLRPTTTGTPDIW